MAIFDLVLQLILIGNVFPGSQEHLTLWNRRNCVNNEQSVPFQGSIPNDHTHFSIFNKENIERDEDAEVEDVNTVLDSHL